MLKNHFKLAFRVFKNHPVYSSINAIGLSLGLSVCLVIFLVVDHELSFDTFHPDKERIFRIGVAGIQDGVKWQGQSVPAPMPLALRAEATGFDALTALHYYRPIIKVPVHNQEAKQVKGAYNSVIVTDQDYFQIFRYTWLAGAPNVLEKPFSVVITEGRAQQYFGDIPLHEMIGREILYDSLTMTVSGIVDSWRAKTDFPMTDFISFATISSSSLKNSMSLDSWLSNFNSSQAFVKISTGKKREEVERIFSNVAKTRESKTIKGPSSGGIVLQPLGDIHTNPDFSMTPRFPYWLTISLKENKIR